MTTAISRAIPPLTLDDATIRPQLSAAHKVIDWHAYHAGQMWSILNKAGKTYTGWRQAPPRQPGQPATKRALAQAKKEIEFHRYHAGQMSAALAANKTPYTAWTANGA